AQERFAGPRDRRPARRGDRSRPGPAADAESAGERRHVQGRVLDGHREGVRRGDGAARNQGAGGPGDLGGTMAGMREIRIEKVVVNVGVGEAGEKLVKAQKVLELVTKQKSVQTLSHQAVRDWGVRRNMPIV